MKVTGRVYAPGDAEGPALVLREPVSFWGGIDAASGRIIDRAHPDVGVSITGTVLVMPGARGSSSSSSVLAESIRIGTGPAAIVLAVPDPILPVGALVAASLYNRRCPIVVRAIDGIRTGDFLRVQALEDGRATPMPFRLTRDDLAVRDGAHGEGAAFAMHILSTFAEAVGAPALLDIHGAHIDGCLYHGQVNLDFVERLVAGSARVRVPTTLNVGAVDLVHPELVRLDRREYAAGRRLMMAHQSLGCEPSFTCAPYQTQFRPAFGDQVAWGESNAIVFANSVIGARTNRYGDFIDLCCAVTGRAPAWGLHLDEHRRGELLFRLTGFPTSLSWSDSLAVGVGLFVGAQAGDRVPVVEGLPPDAEHGAIEDYLKALGAAAASSGAVALFHAVGITPEAPTTVDALGGRAPLETIEITPADLRASLQRLSTVPDGSPITAVCLGTPHFSRAEWDRLLPRLRAGQRSAVPIYVNTGRAILQDLEREGALADAQGLNLTVVADTCTYLTPILQELEGVVMTNSGKWAYYGPGNLGVRVAFGDIEDCLASAISRRVVRRSP